MGRVHTAQGLPGSLAFNPLKSRDSLIQRWPVSFDEWPHGRESAVHRDQPASDSRGPAGQQPGHGFGHFLRRLDSAQRVLASG